MIKKFGLTYFLMWLAVSVAANAPPVLSGTCAPVSQTTIHVPQDYPTIQAGIDAAQNGDLVPVSPGTYNEQLTLSGKTITVVSHFFTSHDKQSIHATIIDGGGQTVIPVDPAVGPQKSLSCAFQRNGFTQN